MSTSSPFSASPRLLRFSLLFLTSALLSSTCLHAQAAKAAASSGEPSTPSSASGFSIETEMLTYRALESNGEAIACDVASYLENVKTSFQSQPSGAVCNVPSANGPSTVGIVVLPFDRTVFSEFMIWRSDMQTMAEFEARGANACAAAAAAPPTPEPSRPAGVSGRAHQLGGRCGRHVQPRRRCGWRRPEHTRPLCYRPRRLARRRHHSGPGLHGQRRSRTSRHQRQRPHA